MAPRKLTHYFDRVTNIAVVVAAIILTTLFVRSYLSGPPAHVDPDPFSPGTVLHKVEGLNLHGSVRTLVLALSTDCRYCTQSLPFYKELIARVSKQTSGAVQVVAVFPEARDQVETYTRTHELTITAVSGVNYRTLQIPFTPALILVDSNGEVLSSWGGKLSEDEQKDVYNALKGSARSSEESPGSKPSEITQTVSLFDETRPIADIKPAEDLLVGDKKSEKLLNAVRRQINHFAADPHGNVYLALWNKVIAYDADGKLLWSADSPDGFKGAFCADDRGQLYVPAKVGIQIYSQSSSPRLAVPASKLPYSQQAVVIKTVYDTSSQKLYIQSYDPVSVSQTLFKLDPVTAQSESIYTQKNQVKFTPTYAPGAFDFALGPDQIFVSDIYDYRVYMFSRITGKYMTEFHKSVVPQAIGENDGVLVNRKMTVGNLTGPGMLQNYPPILHLAFTNQGYVAVWTSERDSQLRQKVDVYDSKMNFLGVDLKYAHPGVSNYVFANNKVYVPDLGFGRTFPTRGISPLDVPSKPLGLKVFDDSFHRI